MQSHKLESRFGEGSFFFFMKILNPPKTTFACSSSQEKLPILFLLVNASMLPTKGTELWPNQSCTQHL